MSIPNLTDEQIFFKEAVILRIPNRETKEVEEFKIEEFVFENRVKALKILTDVFRNLSQSRDQLDKLSNTEIVNVLIEVAGLKLGDLYSLVLNRDIEWVKKNLTLKYEVQLLTAIMEVNEIPFLLSQIQKSIKKIVTVKG